MKNYYKNIFRSNRKWRMEGFLCFLLAIGLFVACEGALEDGNPFGPSNSGIVINPSTPQLNKGGTLTFAAFGGTLPLSWSLSNTQIGAIDAGTGLFTSNQAVPQVAGTSTVTVVDAVGDSDTATIQVLPNALAINPGSSTQNTAGTQAFTVTGAGTNALVATITNSNTSSTFALPTLVATAADVTVTFTVPSTAEGNQTLTISILDTVNGDVGSVVLTLIAS
ncbi:MAG: hypothetical protein ACI9UO_000472 [Nitrospinales bacterium]|jgi:hypothetical protein